MDISTRIKLIRKELNKNQAEFAEPLGLKQSTIGNYESGSRHISDATILAICREYGVDEHWLRFGDSDKVKFIDSDIFSLDDFAKQKGATELELNIMKAYFELPSDIRKFLLEHFKRLLTTSESKATLTTQDMTVAEAEAEYIKSRSAFVKKKDLSVLSSTEDAGRNNGTIPNASNQ